LVSIAWRSFLLEISNGLVLSESILKRCHQTFQDRYIILSELSFGRMSNLKISVAEVIGLSLALNRTAVFPKFETCMLKTEEFDLLFDPSRFCQASIVSSSGLDLNRICEDNAASVVASNLGNPRATVRGEISIDLARITPPELILTDDADENIFKSYPYDKYFLPTTASWASAFISDRLLVKKLEILSSYKCIILGKNFFSINWAQLPNEFEEVHRELIPSPSIRADVHGYLQRNGLFSESAVQFIAIHLRMGDFLTSTFHRGFGFECNKNPELLISHVQGLLTRLSKSSNALLPPILLATDDYNSVCSKYLQLSFSIISLDGASRFHKDSCQGALFDQEVLGASSYFFGDKMSTFSQAIHQIRTIRYGHETDTTTWL
jgi:hypothetical protein